MKTTTVELEDDEEDEDLVVFTAKEAAGALATIYGFVKPYLRNYKKILTFVGLGVLVETLFNVIMPLSLKFLIDDALGEEDFEALVKILSVLAVAGIFTSIVAVWYERWDARLAASLISDVRTRLFEHVQNLPSAYFARTKRGEILSRFSVDLSAFEGSVKSFANSAALPFFGIDRRHHPDAVPELAAGRGGAAGVSDHADRSAHPDAQSGAGELRAEAQRVVAARHGAGKRRGASGDQGVQPAAPDARLVHDAQRRCAPEDRLRDVPVDDGRAHRHHLRCCCCISWCSRSAPISPPRARSPSGPS